MGYHPDLIHTARQVNNRVGEHVAARVLAMLAERGRAPAEARILVLGVTFKEDCPDLRNSRALELAQRLRDAGAQVEVSDPWVGPAALTGEGLDWLAEPGAGRYDAVVLAVAHARSRQWMKTQSGRCWRQAAWSTTSNRPGRATWLTIVVSLGSERRGRLGNSCNRGSHAPVHRLPARHPDVPDMPVAGHDLAGLVLGRRPDCRDGGIGDLGPAAERSTLRRNYPVMAHFRYGLESIGPEIRQYFVQSDLEDVPFSRQQRALIYQRAKNEMDTVPFGTLRSTYAVDYEWINHSLAPTAIAKHDFRVLVGPNCAKPYSASVFNISAMSFGSLSANAIRALNEGARRGGSTTTPAKVRSRPITVRWAAIWSGNRLGLLRLPRREGCFQRGALRCQCHP